MFCSVWLRSAQDLASCTPAEQLSPCAILCAQAEISAKYKLLAVNRRCFVLPIIIVGKVAVEEIMNFFFFFPGDRLWSNSLLIQEFKQSKKVLGNFLAVCAVVILKLLKDLHRVTCSVSWALLPSLSGTPHFHESITQLEGSCPATVCELAPKYTSSNMFPVRNTFSTYTCCRSSALSPILIPNFFQSNNHMSILTFAFFTPTHWFAGTHSPPNSSDPVFFLKF